MDDEFHDLLLEKTEILRALTSEFSTEALAGLCYRKLSSWFVSQNEVSPLASPSKQIYFMLGLMLTTAEPGSPRKIKDDDWDQIVELLNWIFTSYARMYWPKDGKLADMDDSWKRVREISMPAFLDYFNTSMLASVEEIQSRIKAYLSPFDQTFMDLIKISATEVLNVTGFIHHHLQNSLAEVQEAFRAEYESRSKLLEKFDGGKWDLERLRDETRRAGHLDIYADIESKLDDLIKQVGVIGKFEPPSPGEAVDWIISERAAHHEIKINRNAAELMVDRLGSGLDRLDMELAKLASFIGPGKTITRELVVEMVGMSREEEAWILQEAMATGDADAALSKLRELMDVSRHNEVPLMWGVIDLTRKLYASSKLMRQGMDDYTVAHQIGLWGESRGPILRAAKKIDSHQLAQLLRNAVMTDKKNKSGMANPRRSLEVLTMHIADTIGSN
ncbi:MAG: hypothetical protein IH891_06550 [Planctomycetes bacterium]|nr:hypothetical protein [Planctomycetota bacterium]